MPSPLVSVIVPTYNRATLLTEAVDSLLTQTYSNVEIIVVDDGSTDNTQELLRGYGDRVTALYQENRGRSAARNAGVRRASGHYLVFLDSDDLLLPAKIERQVEFLESHADVALVYGDGFTMDEYGKLYPLEPFVTRLLDVDDYTFVRHLLRTNLFTPNTAMVRRSAFDSVPPFDESMAGLEDWDLWLRMVFSHQRFCYQDTKVAVYRRHAGNTDILNPRNFMRDKIRICSKIVDLELDVNLPPSLRQYFRLNHLDALLLSASPPIILSAIRTIVHPQRRVSLRGCAALVMCACFLPIRAADVLGIFARAWLTRNG